MVSVTQAVNAITGSKPANGQLNGLAKPNQPAKLGMSLDEFAVADLESVLELLTLDEKVSLLSAPVSQVHVQGENRWRDLAYGRTLYDLS
jgi:hypothetical protein